MSGTGCKDEIFTLHAPLIHKARDIQFQITYDNGGTPAIITDITQKNVQFALEEYLSKAGLPVKNEVPIGFKNSVNLIFSTVYEFVSGSLEVYLSCNKLNGNQSDPRRDFDVLPNNMGFVFRLDSNDPNRLNVPPFQDEPLICSYSKRITFNTKGGT
ncbi:MAG TPA: hypothetical protein ENL10_05340 [Candidatus Cloacimonetes bacterium]|nr:hypothetical protein [Candidatus Cloacimonadota bacterium]